MTHISVMLLTIYKLSPLWLTFQPLPEQFTMMFEYWMNIKILILFVCLFVCFVPACFMAIYLFLFFYLDLGVIVLNTQ